jgi:hypothetical protein
MSHNRCAAAACSAGLDWLVHVAGLRGLKLLLVLTNGASPAWGGMKQYTDWVDPGRTVTDFYGNDTVKVGSSAPPCKLQTLECGTATLWRCCIERGCTSLG